MSSIALIAAMTAKDHVIGLNNKMPWHLPADLKHFKKVTQGKPIIMGRKTFESIGRPLPNRRNMVVSRNPSLSLPNCETFNSLSLAIDAAEDARETMIIGGGQIYKQALPLASRLYLTLIEANINGDAYFPDWEKLDNSWICVSEEKHQVDENNAHAYRFVVLER